MIDLPAVQSLLASWWSNYDEANFESWPAHFTSDVHVTSRSDSGHSPVEDFLRSDLHGRDETLTWHTEHRNKSPYPLRHNGTNIYLTASRGGEAGRAEEADFSSYIFVTIVAEGRVMNASSGVVTGTVRVEDGALRIAELQIVLDFTNSRPLEEIEVPVGSAVAQ